MHAALASELQVSNEQFFKIVKEMRAIESVIKMMDPTFKINRIAERLKKHGFKDETEAGISMKLKRGTFSPTFFLACLAAMELEGVALDEI
jgi:hypothetical protein